ncbi:MAG TPA: hypothetical protein EYP85_06345 [Armatimonadetes bacterium]|nr:hypothetical protein [Armatimonadota bacterium]
MRKALIFILPGLNQGHLFRLPLPHLAALRARGVYATYVDLPLPATERTLALLLPEGLCTALRERGVRTWNLPLSRRATWEGLGQSVSSTVAEEVCQWVSEQLGREGTGPVGLINLNRVLSGYAVDLTAFEDSLRWADEQIGRIVRCVEENGLEDTVLFAVASPFGVVAVDEDDRLLVRDPETRLRRALLSHNLTPTEVKVHPRHIEVTFHSPEECEQARLVLGCLLTGENHLEAFCAQVTPLPGASQPTLCLLGDTYKSPLFQPKVYETGGTTRPTGVCGGGEKEEVDVPLFFAGGGLEPCAVPLVRLADFAATLADLLSLDWQPEEGVSLCSPSPLPALPVALRYAPATEPLTIEEETVTALPLPCLPETLRAGVYLAARRHLRTSRGEVQMDCFFTLAASEVAERLRTLVRQEGYRPVGDLWYRRGRWRGVFARHFLVLDVITGEETLALAIARSVQADYEGLFSPRLLSDPTRWALGETHCHTLWSDGAATVPQRKRSVVDAGRQFLLLTDHLEEERGGKPPLLHDETYRWQYVPQVLAQMDEHLLALPGVEFTTDAAEFALNHLLAFFPTVLPPAERLLTLSHHGQAQFVREHQGLPVLGHFNYNLHPDELEALNGVQGHLRPELLHDAWAKGWTGGLLGGSDVHRPYLSGFMSAAEVFLLEFSPQALRWALERRLYGAMDGQWPEEWPLEKPLPHIPTAHVRAWLWVEDTPQGSLLTLPGPGEIRGWAGGFCEDGLIRLEVYRNGQLWHSYEAHESWAEVTFEDTVEGYTVYYLRAVGYGEQFWCYTSPVFVALAGQGRSFPAPEPTLAPGYIYAETDLEDHLLLQPVLAVSETPPEAVQVTVRVRRSTDNPLRAGEVVGGKVLQPDKWYAYSLNALAEMSLPLPPGEEEAEFELTLEVTDARTGRPLPLNALPALPWAAGHEHEARLARIGYNQQAGLYEVRPEVVLNGHFLYQVEAAERGDYSCGVLIGGWYTDHSFTSGGQTYRWLGRLPLAGLRARGLLPGWDYRLVVHALFRRAVEGEVYFNAVKIGPLRGENEQVVLTYDVPGELVGNREEYVLLVTNRWFPEGRISAVSLEVEEIAQRGTPLSFAVSRVELIPQRRTLRPLGGSDERVPLLEWR